MSNGRLPNDEDFFAHTRMSLGDHIEELRGCLWRAVKWFLLAIVIGVLISAYVLEFIQKPIKEGLEASNNRRAGVRLEKLAAKEKEEEDREKEERARNAELTARTIPPTTLEAKVSRMTLLRQLGLQEVARPGQDDPSDTVTLPLTVSTVSLVKQTNQANRIVTGMADSLIVLTIIEGIIVWIKVAIYCGIVIAAPLIFREIWSFIAAGLYPQEKALVWRSLPMAIGLFLAGVALCQFLLLPMAIQYLLKFDEWLDLTPQLRLTDWLSFAIYTPLIFGIAFQTPLVMFVLDRVGIVTVDTFVNYWRISTFVILVLSGFLAPTPDPVMMLALGLPIVGLYWLGIGMCRWWPRPKVDLDVEEPKENVEV
jgi:sec-independent protein translocase protein TatC